LPKDERLSLWRKAHDLRSKGYGPCQVARILGISYGTVEYWFLKGGIPNRDKEPRVKVDKAKRKEIAYLAGVIDSDGWISYDPSKRCYQIALQTTDLDFAEEFSKAITTVTGEEPKILKLKKRSHIYNGRIFRSRKPAVEVYFYSRELCEVLKQPDEYVETCPEEYIRGFADGDGTIYYDCNGHCHIRIFNKERYKLEKIQGLLSKLHIGSIIEVHDKKTGLFALTINRLQDIAMFMEKIGFTINRKKNKLNWILKQVEKAKGEKK
jgi:intein-encoded DNA endonuclease-like protein